MNNEWEIKWSGSHVNRVIVIKYGNYYTITQAYDFSPPWGNNP
jgi:hypothetical protein